MSANRTGHTTMIQTRRNKQNATLMTLVCFEVPTVVLQLGANESTRAMLSGMDSTPVAAIGLLRAWLTTRVRSKAYIQMETASEAKPT
eukprot:2446472-Amphidinium_carterae.1